MSSLDKVTDKLAAFSSSLEKEEWEHEVGLLKRFVRLTDDNRGLFFTFLGRESDIDSYLTSPVYYAMTGRNGLWLYQDGNTYVPICWHPNVDGQILVFPPRGQRHPTILQKVLTELPIPPAGVKLARIKMGDIGPELVHNISDPLERSISLSLVDKEPILDWRYPVHILSADRVAKTEGRFFMKTRNCIRQMDQHDVSVIPLSMSETSQVVGLAQRWAKMRSKDPAEIQELVSPYLETMELLRDDVFNVDGQMFFVDGVLEAVTMWEMPNTAMKIANVCMNLCNTKIRGLSEFIVKTTAEELQKRGVPYINYGGSETEGLDWYKRKFDPAFSIDLKSMDVTLKGVDTILHSLLEIQKSRIAA